VQLYHGKGDRLPVTKDQWANAVWELFKKDHEAAPAATYGVSGETSKPEAAGGIDEEAFKKAAGIQFDSPAFAKDANGALTQEGGLKICEASLKTTLKDLDGKVTPQQLLDAVQLYHGKGDRLPVTKDQWANAVWELFKKDHEAAPAATYGVSGVTSKSEDGWPWYAWMLIGVGLCCCVPLLGLACSAFMCYESVSWLFEGSDKPERKRRSRAVKGSLSPMVAEAAPTRAPEMAPLMSSPATVATSTFAATPAPPTVMTRVVPTIVTSTPMYATTAPMYATPTPVYAAPTVMQQPIYYG